MRCMRSGLWSVRAPETALLCRFGAIACAFPNLFATSRSILRPSESPSSLVTSIFIIPPRASLFWLWHQPRPVPREQHALPYVLLVAHLHQQPLKAYRPPCVRRSAHPERAYVELEAGRVQPPLAQLVLEHGREVDPLGAARYLQAAVHKVEGMADVRRVLGRHGVE